MTPDLTAYAVILLSTSGGKDSQVMLDEVHHMATSQGVADRLVAVHCDLGRVEWKGTRELAERQARHYGIRFEVVSRNVGDLLTHIEARSMFPSNTARYCTSDHKRAQVCRVMTKLTDEIAASRPVRILNCMGLRAQESPVRAKRNRINHTLRKDQSLIEIQTALANGERGPKTGITWLKCA